MVSLYVTSLESGDGKTALCAGIARRFVDANRTVGFLKPVVARPELPGNGYVDPDAVFLKRAFSLEEPQSSVNVIAPPDKITSALQAAAATLEAKRRDLVIVEGLNIGGEDAAMARLSAELSKGLRAKVLLVCKHKKGLSPDKITRAVSPVKDALLGVIVTAVPGSRLDEVRQSLAAPLEKDGIKLLAIVPEDRVLLSVSVADLADGLQGEVLVNKDRLDEMVENLMIGAMTLESGKSYFGRKTNKVAIIRGERPDMMLASLHTSTVGIISTGQIPPSDSVMLEAEVRKTPIIAVRKPTHEVAAAIESILAKARFRQEKKLERLRDVLSKTLDFKTFSRALGLSL